MKRASRQLGGPSQERHGSLGTGSTGCAWRRTRLLAGLGVLLPALCAGAWYARIGNTLESAKVPGAVTVRGAGLTVAAQAGTGAVATQSEAARGGERLPAEAEILAKASKSETFDYGAMRKALGGQLTPELDGLTRKHVALATALNEASTAYDAIDAAHSAAVREGRSDPELARELDAKAEELRVQVEEIRLLNDQIAATFAGEFEARIASLGR